MRWRCGQTTTASPVTISRIPSSILKIWVQRGASAKGERNRQKPKSSNSQQIRALGPQALGKSDQTNKASPLQALELKRENKHHPWAQQPFSRAPEQKTQNPYAQSMFIKTKNTNKFIRATTKPPIHEPTPSKKKYKHALRINNSEPMKYLFTPLSLFSCNFQKTITLSKRPCRILNSSVEQPCPTKQLS